ncbi:MAG: type II toxin-antitoxin system RelB/DinJ family antitoxin [Ignavibacteriales bacterium]|nr:type II toxin-antitoxin system RelB/DinJ family antitoxin [Ignavibacteriales bacterium]
MGKTATLHSRIDEKTKINAKKIFAKVGLSESEAIRLFYHHSVLARGIPFDLRIPNAETRAAIEDARQGNNLSKKYKNVDELFEDLNK